uniref:PDZ domain-containing protein n=1 Tax=Salarias fasciatus TaxID=181472 RepID=A0A672HDY9_SALFA
TAKDGCAEGLVYGGGGRDGIFIKGVVPESPASKSLKLKEGDQILSATVYFDNVSYEDAIQILEHAQAYKMKLCLKRKPDISQTEAPDESDAIPVTISKLIPSRLCSPDGKKKKKEKSELKLKILGKDKSKKAKSSPKRLKTLGASLEVSDQNDTKTSDVAATAESTQVDVSMPKVELHVSDGDFQQKSPQKGKEKTQKSKQKQEAKAGAAIKLPQVGLGDASIEDTIRQVSVNAEEYKPKTELLTTTGAEVKDNPYDKLSKDRFSGKQLPKHATVTLPEAKAVVKGPPEIDAATASVTVSLSEQKIDAEKPEVDIKPPQVEGELDAQGNKFKMPKFGIKMPKLESPKFDINISKTDGDVKLQDAEAKVKTPKAPKADLTLGSELDPEGIKFKLPKLGIALPKVKGPEVDLGSSKKGVDVTSPEVEGKIHAPDAELKAKVEITAPDAKGSPLKFKMPTFKLPKFEVAGPNISAEKRDVNADGADIKIPEEGLQVTITTPSIDAVGSSIDIKAKGPDLEGKGGKFKIPSLGFSKPKMKEPKVDLSKKEVDVTLPQIKAEVALPKTDMEEKDISLPDVKMKMPDTEVKLKGPEFDLGLSKGKVDVKIPESQVKLPEVDPGKIDVSLSNATIEVKKPDMETRPLETEGQQGGKFKMPNFDIKMPKIKGPEIDLSLSRKDAGVKTPQIDLTVGKVEVEEQDSKLKMPKFGVSMPKVKGPEIHLGLSNKDAEVTAPEVKADVELKAPSAKIEMKAPQVDVAADNTVRSSTQFTMPNISFSIPKVTGPDIHFGLPKKDADVKLPAVKAEVKLPEAPETDVKLGSVDVSLPEAKMKLENKFKMPKLGIKMPKLEGPKFDVTKMKLENVKAPEAELNVEDVDVKLPEVKADVKLPGVEVKKPSAEVEIKSPEIKLQTKDTDGSPSKFKMPTFKMPKFGGGSPNVSVDVPDMDKDMKLEGADIKIPEDVLTVEVVAPSIKTKGPSIDIKMAETEKERRGSKFKFPSLGFKGPEIDLSASKKDAEVKLPEVKAEVKLPDVEVKQPSAEVEIKSPEIKFETKDTDGSPSKFKMPTFKMPKFGGGSPSVSVDVPDMDKDMKLEGADIKVPEEVLTVEVVAPSIKTKGPSIDIKMAETEKERRGSKFKFPSLGFKGPEVDISKKDAEVKLPEVKAEVQVPDVKVKKPSAEVEIKSPGIDLKATDVEGSPSKIKMPAFKFPKFGVGGPQVSVEGPDLDKDMHVEGADLKIEGPKVEVKLPDVKVKEPSGSISAPQAPEAEADAKSRKTSWTMPRFSFSKPSVKAPEEFVSADEGGDI